MPDFSKKLSKIFFSESRDNHFYCGLPNNVAIVCYVLTWCWDRRRVIDLGVIFFSRGSALIVIKKILIKQSDSVDSMSRLLL